MSMNETQAAELVRLRTRVAEMEAELETERMRLVACGVAALANTPESSAHRIGRENPYWSSSYEDVCAAVDREIALRTWAEKAEAVRKHAFGILEEYRRYGDVCATNWSVLRDHLFSCPPLESVTGKEAEGETPDAAESALSSVLVERAKQDAKWGVQNHEPEWWYAILGEEFGEVGRAMLEARFGNAPTEKIRDEVVQCAAVALAWVECIVRAALAAEEEER